MKVRLAVVSKEYRVSRCHKYVEIEELPKVGEVLTFPVGLGGAGEEFVVINSHNDEAELEYRSSKISLDHLKANGWKESSFCWPN